MSDRKRYKNARQQAALDKRQGTLEYGQASPPPRDRQAKKAEFLQRKGEARQQHAEKPRWTRKPPSPQPLRQRGSGRDDSQMHIKPLPEGEPVRTYRVEVQSFNPKFPHVNVHGNRSRVDLYTAGKPTDVKSWYHETRDDKGLSSFTSAVGKGKKTPRKDANKFNEKFLGSRKDQPSGSRTFYNFGEPSRALHFHHQKSNNPTEIRRGHVFQIKSFLVPHDVFQQVVKDSVHENDATSHPNAPINVDRKAPNQFGLPQAYTSLLEERQIPGTARIENARRLQRKFPIEPEPGRRRKSKPSDKPNPPLASKGIERREMLHEAQQARQHSPSSEHEPDRSHSFPSPITLASFLSPAQKRQLGLDRPENRPRSSSLPSRPKPPF